MDAARSGLLPGFMLCGVFPFEQVEEQGLLADVPPAISWAISVCTIQPFWCQLFLQQFLHAVGHLLYEHGAEFAGKIYAHHVSFLHQAVLESLELLASCGDKPAQCFAALQLAHNNLARVETVEHIHAGGDEGESGTEEALYLVDQRQNLPTCGLVGRYRCQDIIGGETEVSVCERSFDH